MRTKTIGLIGSVFAVAVGVAACGGSGTTTTVSHTSSAATPAAARSTGPFTAQALQGALPDPASWGSGWTDIKDGPLVKTDGLGTVGQISGEDCWTAVYAGTRIGSLVSVQDIVDSHSGDVGHQSAYQFAPGDAAAMMTATAKRIDDCKTFQHTGELSLPSTVQVQEDPVPGLGDQAYRSVMQATSQTGTDYQVSLVVRYGDVVIDVGYDASVAGTALDYDLAGKVRAIAKKLGVAAAGS